MKLSVLFAKKPKSKLSLLTKQHAYKTELLLVNALKLLKEEGWTQGAYQNRRGYCISGALLIGNPMSWALDRKDAFYILHQTIGLRANENLADWNDKWYRTKWHVYWTLNKAIKKVRELGVTND